jgi:hypothetical protein
MDVVTTKEGRREVDTIIVYRNGAFAEETPPEWYRRAFEAESDDWLGALGRVLGTRDEISIGGILSTDASALFWETPGGGRYVELIGENGADVQVWVAAKADWPKFYTDHVLPSVRAHSQAIISERLDRLTRVFMSYARHGGGMHIDPLDGSSRLDKTDG